MSSSSSSSLTSSQSSAKQPLGQSTNKPPEQTATSPRKSVTIDEMHNELKLLDKWHIFSIEFKFNKIFNCFIKTEKSVIGSDARKVVEFFINSNSSMRKNDATFVKRQENVQTGLELRNSKNTNFIYFNLN